MDINCSKCKTNIVYNKNYFPNNFEYKTKVAFDNPKKIVIGLYNLINLIEINNNKNKRF